MALVIIISRLAHRKCDTYSRRSDPTPCRRQD